MSKGRLGWLLGDHELVLNEVVAKWVDRFLAGEGTVPPGSAFAEASAHCPGRMISGARDLETLGLTVVEDDVYECSSFENGNMKWGGKGWVGLGLRFNFLYLFSSFEFACRERTPLSNGCVCLPR